MPMDSIDMQRYEALNNLCNPRPYDGGREALKAVQRVLEPRIELRYPIIPPRLEPIRPISLYLEPVRPKMDFSTTTRNEPLFLNPLPKNEVRSLPLIDLDLLKKQEFNYRCEEQRRARERSERDWLTREQFKINRNYP